MTYSILVYDKRIAVLHQVEHALPGTWGEGFRRTRRLSVTR